MKKLLIAAGILVGIPLLLLVAAALFIDPIARAGVEKGASAALKVPVRLDRATIHFSGRAGLGRLEIGNPPGYAEKRAVAFDRLDAALRPSTLLKSVVRIDEVTLIRPEMALEFQGTKSNLSVLMDNLSRGRRSSADGDSGKKFLIRKLRIENAVVAFRSDLIPGGTRSLTVPSMELENLGTAEGGATMADILEAVLQALLGASLKAGEGVLPPGLMDLLHTDFRSLPGKSLDDLKKRLEDLKSRKPDASGVEQKVKGLFEKKTAD